MTRGAANVEGPRGASPEIVAQLAPPDVVQALAQALAKTEADMPRIRKTNDTPPSISIYVVIVAFTGCDPKHAHQTFKLLCQEHAEVHTICANLQFAGAGQRDTPVTDAKGVVKIVMLLPGHHAAAARKKVAEVFVRFLGGDLSLVREAQQNRELQDLLRRDHPQHPMRVFGEHVEAATSPTGSLPPTQELVQKTCETVIVQTVVPAMIRVVDEAFSAKLDEITKQACATRKQWERAMLQKVETAIRDIHRASLGRPVVNINTSARHAADLERINVDAPENPEDVATLRNTASPLTKFLREKWQPEWLRAGVRHTSVSLHFSILMQAATRVACRV